MPELTTVEQEIIDDLIARRPELAVCVDALLALHEALVHSYDADGKVLVCGNGGSNADSMHIVGELCKSFERKRPLAPEIVRDLEGLPWGDELAEHLEQGLPAIALGFNGSLKTAVENDSPLRDIAFAQECCTMARKGDVFIGISTSGNATNCLMALSAAKAVGCTTVSLTGPHGGKLAMHADIAVKAPGETVAQIQEAHISLYHAFCSMIEAHYFPEYR
ncbi:MAG: SIS domain-containing protein [Candidatus Hydrogenedentes bacterium]|nr:SIS domain-containing protein [Candidatus Hydrogenedentota bacterium]